MDMGYNNKKSALQDIKEMSHLHIVATSIGDKQSPIHPWLLVQESMHLTMLSSLLQPLPSNIKQNITKDFFYKKTIQVQGWHLGKYIKRLDHSPRLWKFYKRQKEITTPSQFKWFYKLDRGKKIKKPNHDSWLWKSDKGRT